jgi:hypothetical protein
MLSMKAKKRSRAPAIFYFALGLIALPLTGATGCDTSPASLCDARCACEGCSRKEYEDCVDDIEDALPIAEDDGCSGKFDAYISCYTDSGKCENDVFRTDCRSEGDSLKSCTQLGSTFVKTICQEASEKRVDCGFGSGGFSPECTGADSCAAGCDLSATCQEINNPAAGDPYTNCVEACASLP